MGVQSLQNYIERECEAANVPVDLAKLLEKATEAVVEAPPAEDGAASAATPATPAAPAAPAKPPTGLKLVIDAECCLDRLYGGRHADWVAGGQWNRMLEFLTALNSACVANGIKLVVFLNGAFEKSRLRDWAEEQVETRNRIQTAMREVQRNRRVPPAKLWVAPACLRQGLRLALRHIGIATSCSMDDHHQEVIAYCRENSFDGLLARDADYAIFDPPRYFSANLFKLTFKRDIQTTEYVLDTVAKALDLHPERFCLVGALLGNHILTDADLKDFHEKVVIAEDASKKNLAKAVSDFVRLMPSIEDEEAIAKQVFPTADAESFPALLLKLKTSIQYYNRGTDKGFQAYRLTHPKKALKHSSPDPETPSSPVDKYGPFASDSEAERTSLQVDTLVPTKSVSQLMLLRHQRGLMMPWIHQILTHREVKFEAVMEDVTKENTPSAVDLYREVRQNVYGLLLDAKSKEGEGKAESKRCEDVVNEWYVTRGNAGERPDPVPATPLDWQVPTLERLWFGSDVEDGQRRLRAFLSCMKADEANILDSEKVPRQYLLLCTVLRYMLEYSKGKTSFLSKAELEAFLATAVCPVMKNVRLTKEMRLRKVYTRGLSLGALFMQGVEMASFANDACGSPIPWQLTCPWEFFDGKIFHLKLIKASTGRPLLEVCDGEVQQLVEVERMRDAILAGGSYEFLEPKIGRPVDAAAAAAQKSPEAAAKAPKKAAAATSAKVVATPLMLASPPTAKKGRKQKPTAQSNEAERYAAAYASAYVAYSTPGKGAAAMPKPSPKAGKQEMEAEAYAAGYAAAAAGYFHLPLTPAKTPTQRNTPRGQRSPFFFQRQPNRNQRQFYSPRYGGNASAKIQREAAAYANYHSFSPYGGNQPRLPRGPRTNTKSNEEMGSFFGGYGAVDYRYPMGSVGSA